MKQKEAVPAGTEFVEKNIREFQGSPFERIGKGWMLITAGNAGDWNTMTASWGGLGVLWGRDVAFIFIRPCRLSFDFVNAASLFSLSFFYESHRKALNICGEKSGRDIDKASVTGLTPILFEDSGAVGFKEAREIMICRKLYTHDLNPAGFLDAPAIEIHYPLKDYHRMYIGEITGLKTRV